MQKRNTDDRAVDVLGLGSMGLFAAHCLTEIHQPPKVKLLLHRPSLLDAYIENNCSVGIESPGGEKSSRNDYGVGVTLKSPFNIKHTGASATFLGAIPQGSTTGRQSFAETMQVETDLYLLRHLPLASRLNARSLPYLDVLQAQLEKLTINSFCNPICALNNASNGHLFTVPSEVLTRIVTEISSVVLALPEVRAASGLSQRLSPENLATTVMDVIRKTAMGTCSMVFDMRAGRKTEIEFINGYSCRRGKEVNVGTPENEQLLSRVLQKTEVN